MTHNLKFFKQSFKNQLHLIGTLPLHDIDTFNYYLNLVNTKTPFVVTNLHNNNLSLSVGYPYFSFVSDSTFNPNTKSLFIVLLDSK